MKYDISKRYCKRAAEWAVSGSKLVVGSWRLAMSCGLVIPSVSEGPGRGCDIKFRATARRDPSLTLGMTRNNERNQLPIAN
jgi:hypothetical protein